MLTSIAKIFISIPPGVEVAEATAVYVLGADEGPDYRTPDQIAPDLFMSARLAVKHLNLLFQKYAWGSVP